MDDIIAIQTRYVAALALIKDRIDYDELFTQTLQKRIEQKPPARPAGILFFAEGWAHKDQKKQNEIMLSSTKDRLKKLNQFYQSLDDFSQKIHDSVLLDWQNRVYYFRRYLHATTQVEQILALTANDPSFEWQCSNLTYDYNTSRRGLTLSAFSHFTNDYYWPMLFIDLVINQALFWCQTFFLAPVLTSLIGSTAAFTVIAFISFAFSLAIFITGIALGTYIYELQMKDPISDDDNAYLPINAISATLANEAATAWQNKPAKEQEIVNEQNAQENADDRDPLGRVPLIP